MISTLRWQQEYGSSRNYEGRCWFLENHKQNDNCDAGFLSGPTSLEDNRTDISRPAVNIDWNGNASDANQSIVEN
jgi:hypothetical protein